MKFAGCYSDCLVLAIVPVSTRHGNGHNTHLIMGHFDQLKYYRVDEYADRIKKKGEENLCVLTEIS